MTASEIYLFYLNLNLHSELDGSYSRPLLGATIAPNLLLRVLRKMFSLEMVEKASVLGVQVEKMPLFSEYFPPNAQNKPCWLNNLR